MLATLSHSGQVGTITVGGTDTDPVAAMLLGDFQAGWCYPRRYGNECHILLLQDFLHWGLIVAAFIAQVDNSFTPNYEKKDLRVVTKKETSAFR